MKRSVLLALAVTLLATQAVAATFPFTCSTGDCRLDIKWPDAATAGTIRLPRDAADKTNTNITSATPLTINITNFNFLNYELKFDVQKKPVESYGYLENLWKQILGLGAAGLKGNVDPKIGTEPDPFYVAMRKWRSKLRETDTVITDEAAPFTKPGLTDTEVAAVKVVRDAWVIKQSEIAQAQADAEATLDRDPNLEKIQFFEATQQLHNQVEQRLRAAIAAGNLTVSGLTKTFAGLASGNVVTITATPQEKAGASGKPVVVQFFVNSELPVTYHVGLGYNRLGEVKFDKVKTVAGADLFTQVTDEKAAEDLVAFLSYQLGRPQLPPKKLGSTTKRIALPLFISLGTDVTKPGETFYVGGTVQVGRFFFTAGAISGKVAEGENKVIDTIVDTTGKELGTRELFTTIRNRREWKPAFAITFRPF